MCRELQLMESRQELKEEAALVQVCVVVIVVVGGRGGTKLR